MKDKDRVVSYKCYAPWEYEKEEQDLNEASKKGLQLTEGKGIHSVFHRDDSVRYIYQLDYNTKVKDKERYKEIFEEQGWEYINSTFNGWHYFRKLYKEDMPEDEKVIYTDRESLYEMQDRWKKFLTIITIVLGMMAITYGIIGIMIPNILIVIEGLILGMISLTMGLGARVVGQRRKGKESSFTIKIQWAFPIAFIILIIILIYSLISPITVFHEDFNFIGMTQESLPKSSGEIKIEKDGSYYMDLDYKIDNGTMMISIQNEKGEEIYRNVADRCSVNDWKLDLHRGNYRIYYAYYLEEQTVNKVNAMVKVEITR